MKEIDVYECGYNRLLKEYIFYGKCNKCGKSIKLSSKQEILAETVSCDNCGSDKTITKDKFVYNNAVYRLGRIHSQIVNDGNICEEWKEADKFKEWAFENGYKPWKNLYRYDEEGEYNPGNCYWSNDSRQSNYKLTCEKLDDVVKNIKCSVGNVETMMNSVNNIEFSMKSASDYDKELSKDVNNIVKYTYDIKDRLSKISDILDNIDL